jgi:hypothetical protein
MFADTEWCATAFPLVALVVFRANCGQVVEGWRVTPVVGPASQRLLRARLGFGVAPRAI